MRIEEVEYYNPEMARTLRSLYETMGHAAQNGINVRILENGAVATWRDGLPNADDYTPQHPLSVVSEVVGIEPEEVARLVDFDLVHPIKIQDSSAVDAPYLFSHRDIMSLNRIIHLKNQGDTTGEAVSHIKNEPEYQRLHRHLRAEMLRYVTTLEQGAWENIVSLFSQSPSFSYAEQTVIRMKYTGATIEDMKQRTAYTEESIVKALTSAEAILGKEILFILKGTSHIEEANPFVD